MSDLTLFWLRAAFIVGLYLFLVVALTLIWRDLRAQRHTGASGRGAALRVLDAAAAGLRPGTRLPLANDTSIGRSSAAVIALADDSVSGQHALIRYDGGRWVIEDLGSTNGTHVNGQPVRGRVALAFGDEIALGRVRLKLERAA